ncbi:photosystem II protein PsbQ [Lyngbya confervoides]|uniref:Photosystem II protein PsbQ n=1 Tax=Lyngbya confervoides BDU141951 TaxID=1574623 RepID=A0ABD4T3R1_9CYAN|nr:photosystem II protein PsbQ [Lyngbya confervoides]MCM1983372.1 photosystem II protein PsbQ [Lyngbya confervoides BDU141951]
MFKLRSWLSAVLVLLAFVLVSCGGPSRVALPTTYAPEQIEQIQLYVPNILSAKERMSELYKEINEQDWQEAQALMRGPLGEMLQQMKYTASHLLPDDQKSAQASTRAVFEDFIGIDAAAAAKNIYDAQRQYDSAMRDLDRFLSVIPEEAFDFGGDQGEPEVNLNAEESAAEG